MDTLQTVSNEMAQLVETTGASVVRVEARRRLPATGVVMSADGVIVTSSHVVQREDGIRVGLSDGTIVEARFVGRDQNTDVAVLKVDMDGLPPANWATTENARVGHMVLALGRPGKTVQATLGVMSALGDAFQAPTGSRIDRYVQTDVVMYPGFSGGPLVSADGTVLGINTSSLMRGVSLTIPTETVQRVANALLQDGHIKRGYLGITAQTVRLPEGTANDIGQETGLLVASVEPGSPAGSAGVLLGDVVIALDNAPTRSMEELMSSLTGERVGNTVPLKVLRGGATTEIDVTVGERSHG